MEKSAAALPPRADGKHWELLGKSTVGEIVTGKRLPSRAKLNTFLAVCRVPASDLPQWLAAWERASTAEPDGPGGSDGADQEALDAYLRRVQNYFQQLNLEMLLTMVNIEERLRVPLQRLFTPPTARADPPVMELPREFRRRLLRGDEADPQAMPRDLAAEMVSPARDALLQQPARPVLGLLAAPGHSAVVLLGDPGAGKSTIARYVVLRLAQLAGGGGAGPMPTPLDSLSGTLPLLVELRHYTAGNDASFVDFLDHLHHTQGLGLPETVLTKLLNSGRPVLVIFDGLDEVFDRYRRNAVTREIREFANRFPHARLVVTSRPVGYNRQTLDDAGFKLYQLQDLEPGSIASFIAAWYQIACADDRAEAERLTIRMTSAVDSFSAVNELAGNPLLLTLLCIMGRRRELPRDRAHVYEFAVSLLVEHWEVEAHSFPDREGLLYEDKLDLLRVLARLMLAGEGSIGGNRITEQDLQGAFETYLEVERGYDPPVARTAAHSMINQLRTRNYILSRFGAGMYGFVHRTFLEYLAALDIVGRFDDRLMDEATLLAIFDEHGADPAWSEVLLLVIRMKERFAEAIIERLLNADQAWRFDKARLPARSLLCMRALHEVRPSMRLVPQMKAVLTRLFEILLELEANPNGALQAAVRDATLATFATLGHRWQGARPFLTWYSNIGRYLSGSVAVLAAELGMRLASQDALLRVVQIDHDPVVRGAAIAVLASHPENDVAVHADLLRRAGTDPAGDVRRKVIGALVARRDVGDDVRGLLEQRAVNDADPLVRRTCVELLNVRWPADPELPVIVRRRAADDSDPRVRAAAMRVLGQWCGTGDQEIDADVRTCLRTAGDATVRQAAIDGMTTAGVGLAYSYDLIVERAIDDPHRSVRQAAVQALAASAVNRGDTLTLLAERIVADTDASVRQIALEAVVKERPRAGDTRKLLARCAVLDDHWLVRRAALRALANMWPHHPETLPLLAERASADEDQDVRVVALLGLSSPHHDADAFDLLVAAYETDTSDAVRRAVVSMLADTDHDEATARGHILQWAMSDADWSVREHAVITANVQWPNHPDVRKVIRDLAVDDPDEDVRRSALFCVAGARPSSPDLLSFIAERASSDDSDTVRMTALGCMADQWRDHPDTRRALRAHAVGDRDAAIRLAALRAVGATWSADAEVRDLVATAAQCDQDWAVREAAVVLIAERWPGRAETAPMLTERATADLSAEVRQTALRALVMAFPADAGMAATLETAARSDGSATVRRAALRGLAAASADGARELALRLTEDDSHSAVRMAGVEALAYHWADDDAARTVVAQRASDDPDPAVRNAADAVRRLASS
ncbi:HEAT repeat domain-containing protein [Micromonospora humida]|uniref:HEAT repeat domain-containing protein n=1 Tax=Micromonospora humida TaxID=2809018 RepID=A0ABS2INE7_9ACTN|nr:HEAT repeat domain-containing protein [Micromonospora humida]MBM7075536.1 HEAT repeat domain-containing protein [Micromonospora humida]